jgi:hypothetical protein
MAGEKNEKLLKELERLGQTKTDKAELVWAFVDAVAAILDSILGIPVAACASTGGQQIHSTIKGLAEEVDTIPNPWFVWNGHGEGASPYTRKYLRNRTVKGVGGGVFAIGGAAASVVTEVDVAGITSHGNAVGSSAAHLYKLRALAKSHKQSQTITAWIDLISRMKGMKIAVRGTSLAGSCIPVTGVGLATSLAAGAAKVGIKLTHTKVCLMTAADVHWRAYQEQVISGAIGGGAGKVGPASNILYELFSRHGLTRVFGKYDVNKLIREPGGWRAVSDKLLLI